MIDTLASELLVAIFLYLDLRDLVRCKQVCKAFGQILDDTLVLQYKIDCEASGMVDGDITAFTVAERMQRLHDMLDGWGSGTPTETFDLQNKWTASVAHYVEYRPFTFGCVIAVCQVAGNRRCERMRLTQIPSKHRNIEKKEWVLDNLCFDVLGFDIDHSQRLLVTTQTCGSVDHHLLRIRFLDSENGNPHPLAQRPTIEPNTMGSRQLDISGDYVGVLTDSQYFWEPELRVWNWKTGELMLNLYELWCPTFALIDGPHVVIPVEQPISSAESALVVLSCKNSELTSLGSAAETAAVAELTVLAEQCETIHIYTDNSRGSPHDAIVPFSHNPDDRFLRVVVTGLEVEICPNGSEPQLWRDCFEQFISYRSILALMSQTSSLQEPSPIVTVMTRPHPWEKCSVTGDVTDFCGTRIFIKQEAWNKELHQSSYDRCAIFDFNPLPARRKFSKEEENVEDSDEAESDESGETDDRDPIEQALSCRPWCLHTDAYLEYDWMKIRSDHRGLLLDDGFVSGRPFMVDEDLELNNDSVRNTVSAL